MKCTELRRYLEPFLDNELDAEGNLKVLEHLNLCGECNRTFDAEKGMRAHLVSWTRRECCPQALAARCSAALDDEDAARRRRWLTPVLGLAASLAVILCTAWLLPRDGARPGPIPVRTFAAMAASFHNENRESPAGPSLCCRCEPDPKAALGAFFRSRTGTTTCLHDLASAGYDFRSGVVWKNGSSLFCWTIQKNDSQASTISHVALKAAGLAHDAAHKAGQWERYEFGGRVVLMIEVPGGYT